MSYNIPFGFFLLSFNDYIGGIIDSLSMGFGYPDVLDIFILNH